MGTKTRKGKRLKPVSQLATRAAQENFFDKIQYTRKEGQPGVYLNLYKKDIMAFVKVESHRNSEYAYEREGQPTRIATLSVLKYFLTKNQESLGNWDPAELIPKLRHRFEEQEESDPELKSFLEKVFEYFG